MTRQAETAVLGFSATGKSAVADCLQRRGLNVVDVDAWLQAAAGIDIPRFFDCFGAQRFRAMTSELIPELDRARASNAITVFGATYVLDDAWRRYVGQSFSTRIVFEASPEAIVRRAGSHDLIGATAGASEHGSLLAILYHSRRYLYREVATQIIDTTHLTIEQAADEVLVSCA